MIQSIAGITLPDSALASAATEYIREQQDDLLFNHSRRVFLWGALTGERKGLKYEPGSFMSARCSMPAAMDARRPRLCGGASRDALPRGAWERSNLGMRSS